VDVGCDRHGITKRPSWRKVAGGAGCSSLGASRRRSRSARGARPTRCGRGSSLPGA
jgi:hypothetical protein